MRWGPITEPVALAGLADALHPLLGVEISSLTIPPEAAENFEPSQVGTIVGTLTDAVLPFIALARNVGLKKGGGILGDREGYPDFEHEAGYRIELKGLFCDNPEVKLKRPPTRREPSARLTQKVTLKNVRPETDALLILCYRLQRSIADNSLLTPVITDLGLFPVIECVNARDFRLTTRGGVWFGDYETPAVLSKTGKAKIRANIPLDQSAYGRKESEGKDYNEDTNFGKLKRIPYQPLHLFLAKNGAHFTTKGGYPTPWVIQGVGGEDDSDDDD